MSVFTSLPSGGAVVGTAGNDTLYRGKGDSSVDGLGGFDTFAVGGNFADSAIRFDRVAGRWSMGQGPGELALRNVEVLRFADVEVSLDNPVLLQPTRHSHTAGDDVLIGSDLGYRLQGEAGNDTFTGNGGDDQLYGGKGDDTAVYRGAREDYAVERDPLTGSYSVRDKVAGRDGNDTVNGIEHLRFANGAIDIDATPLPPPPSPPGDPLGQVADGLIGIPFVTLIGVEPDFFNWSVVETGTVIIFTGVPAEPMFATADMF